MTNNRWAINTRDTYVDDDVVTICAICIALNLSCAMSHNPSYNSAMATRITTCHCMRELSHCVTL
jgi:hypothetical protein